MQFKRGSRFLTRNQFLDRAELLALCTLAVENGISRACEKGGAISNVINAAINTACQRDGAISNTINAACQRDGAIFGLIKDFDNRQGARAKNGVVMPHYLSNPRRMAHILPLFQLPLVNSGP